VEIHSNESLLIIASKGVIPRLAIATVLIIALAFGWFVVRWQIGFMLADLSAPTEPNAKAIADIAVGFSPSDPLTNWFLVSAARNGFPVEDVETTSKGIENVVRLAPYNFSWWVELGRAYEQANQPEKAEKAFLRAVELAPSYTYPHWQLGNFYLRAGNDVKAFAELKTAAENNSVYREQVFSIAWDYYEQNPQKLEELAGNSAEVRAGLAKFYAVKERPSESLKMWNTLNSDEKQANSDIAKIIAQGLFEKGFFSQSIEFVRDLGIEPNATPETVQNAGFEDPIGENDYVYFGWKIPLRNAPAIAV
jgi:tetratricopeptide (TPR) repeat protein